MRTRPESSSEQLGYQTQYTDPTTNDVLMQARWYSPGTATFRSRDTWAGDLNTPVTLNRYTYGANNPIRYWDPTGRLPCQNPKSDCSAEVAQLGRNYIGLPVKPTKVHKTSTPIGGRTVTKEQLLETTTQVNAASDELSEAQLYNTVNYYSQYIGTGGAPNLLPALGEDSPQAEYFMENLVNGCGNPSSNCHEPLEAYVWELTSAGLPPRAADFFQDNLGLWIDQDNISFPLTVSGWPTTQSQYSNQLLHDTSLVAGGYVSLIESVAARGASFAPEPAMPSRIQSLLSGIDDVGLNGTSISVPQVTNMRLQNYVRDLYKHANRPGTVGNGRTMAAIPGELAAGISGQHVGKGFQIRRGLRAWLGGSQGRFASFSDRLVAQSLYDELDHLLSGGP